jgi:hypothetical protein
VRKIFVLQKRSKKLFSVSGGSSASQSGSVLRAIDKSFLLLFFKKEVLSTGCRHRPRRGGLISRRLPS